MSGKLPEQVSLSAKARSVMSEIWVSPLQKEQVQNGKYRLRETTGYWKNIINQQSKVFKIGRFFKNQGLEEKNKAK